MTGQCHPDIDALTRELGFSCHDAPPIVRVSNPFALANWTLPVLELVIVLGAAFALGWAVYRLRRDGDPVNLLLWFVPIGYLLIVEPPMYFPSVFGTEELLGAVFAHNVFTVQFLYDRLPLYIVALYPAIMTLAYEIVRGLGVFRDRGIVVGALCVGFVHHCCYEVFDQLGPGLRWWAWNYDNAINQPAPAAVPMSSVLFFAAVGPALTTLLVLLLVGRPGTRAPSRLVLRGLAAAILIPVGLVLTNIPIALAGYVSTDGPWRVAVYVAYLALFAAVGGATLVHQWRRGRALPPNPYVRVFGPLYLIALAALWLAGRPADSGPAGSLPYATVCFLIAAAAIAAVSLSPAESEVKP
ncbi:hypothetical protein [Nocardia sp. NPDC057353]|uniref:hypothetical protein n=1 Tax=Nocardia sp. NPDC057353 TaxID=3346104 RepID=UPI00362F3FDA